MSVLDKVSELTQQLIEMGAQFGMVKEQVTRLEGKEAELRERVARLEQQLQTAERGAAEAARSAAHAGVYELQARLTERITLLEERQRRLLGSPPGSEA